MFELIKEKIVKNIIPIVIFIIVTIILFVLNIRVSVLKKENVNLKEKIELKEQTIDDLSSQISKLQTIIKEKEKQKEIEDNLIDQKHETETELNQCKEDFESQLDELKENNDEVKNWCDQPIPSDVSTLFILGLR